jgi:hypothetical protein
MTGAVEATMESLAEREILGESGYRRLALRREGERLRTVPSGIGNSNGAVGCKEEHTKGGVGGGNSQGGGAERGRLAATSPARLTAELQGESGANAFHTSVRSVRGGMHVPPARAQHRADNEKLLATHPPKAVRQTHPGSVLTQPSLLAESSKDWNSLHSAAAASSAAVSTGWSAPAPPRSPHRGSVDAGDGWPPPVAPPRTNSLGNLSTSPQVARPAAKGVAEKSILRGALSNVLNFDEAPDKTAATRPSSFSALGRAPAPPDLLSMAPIARPSPRSSLGGGGWASTRNQEVVFASQSSSSSAIGSPAHGASSQQHQRVAASDRVHVSSPPTGSRSADVSISPVRELVSSPTSHASTSDAAMRPPFISKPSVFVFTGSASPSSSNWHSNGTSACSSPLPGQSVAHADSDEGSGGTGDAAGGGKGEGQRSDGQNGKRKRRVPSKQPRQDGASGGDVPSIVRAAIEVFTPGKTRGGVKTPGRSAVQADCLESKGGGLDKDEIGGAVGATGAIKVYCPGSKDGELERGEGGGEPSEEAAGEVITEVWRTTDVARPLFSQLGEDRISNTFAGLKEQQGNSRGGGHAAPVLGGADGPSTCSQGKEEQDQQYPWGLVLKTSAGKADRDAVGEHARAVPKGGTLTSLTGMDRASMNLHQEARQWTSPLSPQPFDRSRKVASPKPTTPLSPKSPAHVAMSQSMDTGWRMAGKKLQSSFNHSCSHKPESSCLRRCSSDEHLRTTRAEIKGSPSALDMTAMTQVKALMEKKLRTVSFELLQSEQHVMVSARALSPLLTTWLFKFGGMLTIPSRCAYQGDDA